MILGGSGKNADYSPLAAPIRAARRAVYLIGETADEIGGGARRDRRAAAPVRRPRARGGEPRAPRRGPATSVLLSPACASFDQYADYEERGAHFRALVA